METVWKILNYLMARLKEPSTYPAAVIALTAFGAHFTDEQKVVVMEVGFFLAGLIGAALPDRFGKQTRADDPDKTLPPATEKKEPQ